MAYTKTVWAAREGTYLDRFTKSEESGTSVRLVNNPVIETAGTAFSPTAMNNIETGIFTGNTYYPLTGTIAENTTRTISVYPQMMTVIIPKAYLVASSGGPFTLTLTTGVSGKETVIVPIVLAGASVLGDLLFTVYVDSAGNVSGNFCFEGTYTPSASDAGNVAVTSAYAGALFRVNDKNISVMGRVSIDVTSAGTATAIRLTLPTKTTFSAEVQAAGTASTALGYVMTVYADDVTNTDRVILYNETGWLTTTAIDFNFNFLYRII